VATGQVPPTGLSPARTATSIAAQILHTYSSYARGGEELIGTPMILDRAPKGRNEETTMDFVRRHDEYEKKPKLHDCCA
jgi:predicted dithiol-disulfide oxidoreductase (DUF899 family)